MRRREFIMLLGGAAASWPRAVRAQQPGGIRLVGVLMCYAESDPAAQSDVAAFRAILAKLGWPEGGNVRIELRWGTGDTEKIRMFAKELVDMRQTRSSVRPRPQSGLLPTKRGQFRLCSQTWPIRSAAASPQVSRIRAATSPASRMSVPQSAGKWVELLKEIAPRTVRVALLSNPATAVPLEFFMPQFGSRK